MKKLIITLTLLAITQACVAQFYRAKYRVKIPESKDVYRVDKIKCAEKIDSGSIIKVEYQKTEGSKTYTITKLDTLKAAIDTLKFTDKKETNIGNHPGWANVVPDEKDKSKLYINYWLSVGIYLDSGARITTYKREKDCISKGYSDWKSIEEKTLSEREVFFMQAYTDSTGITDHVTEMIIVNGDNYKKKRCIPLTGKKSIAIQNSTLFLINKYDNDTDYIIKLKNREYISWPTRSFDFGPLVIPFKYRPSLNDSIKSDFQGDINLGVFAGHTWGCYRYRYEGKEYKELSDIRFSLGGFLSLGSVQLDSANTSLSPLTFTEGRTQNVPVWSTGIGAMMTIYNFQVGGFVGWDFATSSSASDWNYNKKRWYGIGISYALKDSFLKVPK
jgi:hypothetical protein